MLLWLACPLVDIPSSCLLPFICSISVPDLHCQTFRRLLLPSVIGAQLLLTSALPAASANPMARPVTFTGEVKDCNGFILQCSFYFELQSHQFTTYRARVAFVISLLSGRALQ